MPAPSRTVCAVLLTTGLAVLTAACGGGAGCPDPRTCDGAAGRVEDLPPLSAMALPVWDEPATGEASPPGAPEHVEIHLDVSSPMGGYLRPGASGDLSVFQFVAQNAAQHMARVFGGADAPVRWVGVGHELRSLGARPSIERSLFTGSSTELDLSMERVLGDLRSGRAEAAVVVSDLMATGDVTGPLTLAGALGAWMRSADVRTGAFHVGLFGLKADYWGVRARGCAAVAPLGCRFDELRRRWIALNAVEQIPVYVLVLGYGVERVTSVLESLQATVDELNRNRGAPIETRSELLTRAALGQQAAVACRAGTDGDGEEPEPQYALFADEQQHCCVRDDPVTLFCDVEGAFRPTAARATWAVTPATGAVVETETGTGNDAGDGNDAGTGDDNAGNGDDAGNADDAGDGAGDDAGDGNGDTAGDAGDGGAAGTAVGPPPAIDARIDGTRLAFDVSCSEVRCARPAGSLELRLEATGAVDVENAVDWSGWSTETGEVGRTLQLQGFVETVRLSPDRYQLETPALLRFPGR